MRMRKPAGSARVLRVKNVLRKLTGAVLLCVLGVACAPVARAAAACAPVARAAAAPARASAGVPGDRWMEIDLYWFERNNLQHSVSQFWDRFAPIYKGVEGDKGLILNVGWTVSYIMEFSGDLQQQIILPQGSGEQPWVAETSALPGDTAARQREWKDRFAKPIMVERHGYGVWTYDDLKKIIVLLKQEGERRGIHGFKVGSLVYAWTNAYGEIPPWVKRHPEAFTSNRPQHENTFEIRGYFNPGNRLHAESKPLGGLPHGITEGMPVHQAFAAQWGSLSRATGLDAIMLRDSFGFPVPYARMGPSGQRMASKQAIDFATQNVSALVRETKQSNPKALVMMYSNAASAVGDWRANGCDLERIAHEGFLDVFVDQTWAGAWNEVGVRHNNFWNSPTLGWTYQLAYTLLHRAMLADTKVRHYPLIETFDAWESWDVLHTVPQRLRWGIWAYSHAALKTPRGIEMPQGSYISWANQGKRLLAPEDVDFLATNISAAVRDAAQTKEVYGPTLVYSRAAMQWQIDHATDSADVKEWIDEQMGTVMKWPVPVLSITREEWLGSIHTDLPVIQTPSHLPAAQLEAISQRIRVGRPTAILGSFAGGVDPSLLKLDGLAETTLTEPHPSIHQGKLVDAAGLDVLHVPQTFAVKEMFDRPGAANGTVTAKTVYTVDGAPQLLWSADAKRKLLLWDPPEFTKIGYKPMLELLGGSAAPYVLGAGAMNSMLRDEHALHAKAIDLDQTGSVAAWKTADGHVHMLFGNLEEGLREDADQSRHFAMELPAGWSGLHWRSLWTQGTTTYKAAGGSVEVQLAPDSSLQIEAQAK